MPDREAREMAFFFMLLCIDPGTAFLGSGLGRPPLPSPVPSWWTGDLVQFYVQVGSS